MPRSISVSKKYLPALSREVSLPSSHRSLRARRNPCGGGPAGVAKRCVEVEKVAMGGVVLRAAKKVADDRYDGRARASDTIDRADAMSDSE